MGKRKAAKKAPVKKSNPKLDTVFTCPFCNAESAVEASLDRKMKLGKLVCKACSESWGTEINALTEPIDLYSAWIDACEEAAADANA